VALLGRSATSRGATLTFLAFWFGLNGLQVNLFNFAQHQFGWSKVDSVKLQAASGILLALSNGLGPALLAPRIGQRGTVRRRHLEPGAAPYKRRLGVVPARVLAFLWWACV
jgi:hypothetical protein